MLSGLTVLGEIEEPGYLEGGDFFAAGRDLALLGVGLRSNVEAAKQLMEKDLLGTRRFAVVRDDFEKHQVFSRNPLFLPPLPSLLEPLSSGGIAGHCG